MAIILCCFLEDEELGKARVGREIPGAPKNPALFICTRHGGNSGNPLVTFHLSVFRLSTDAVFKKGGGPRAVQSCTSMVNVLFNTSADKLVASALLQVGSSTSAKATIRLLDVRVRREKSRWRTSWISAESHQCKAF